MLNSQPRLSIGMPVYNGERYLAAAIESILAQTFTDFELVISDNASTDRTGEICRAFAARDPRVRYSRNPVNLGAAPNYNRVFALTTGELFKWADYDDELEPDFLRQCVAVLDARPEVVMCFTRATVIDADGRFVVDHDPMPEGMAPEPPARFKDFMFTNHYAIQASGVTRRAILERTGGYGHFPSSDEVLLAELALYGPYWAIPERLFRVRMHAQQSTRGALQPQRARVIWFDASLQGKIVLAHWWYLQACARAVRRAPLTAGQRWACYAHLARWLTRPQHFRPLGKDLVLGAASLLQRWLFRPAPVGEPG